MDNGKQVMFRNRLSSFYTVSKDGTQQINIEYADNHLDDIENGKIFDKYDVYIDTKPSVSISDRDVFEPTIISGWLPQKIQKVIPTCYVGKKVV